MKLPALGSRLVALNGLMVRSPRLSVFFYAEYHITSAYDMATNTDGRSRPTKLKGTGRD